MADRYWVGGTGTWDGTNTANWSASSGGASGASVPTSADNVFFDANSNTGTDPFTVTADTVAVSCLNFSSAGIDGAMTLLVGFPGISVYGSWVSSSNTSASSGIINFTSTSGVQTITTNGSILDTTFRFDGIGGTWVLQDALTLGTSRSLTLVNGTFNTNNFNVTVRVLGGVSVTGVKTLILGSSVLTLVGTGNVVIATAAGLTVTFSTATINLIGSSAKTFNGGGYSWPLINQGGAGALIIAGSSTFANITNTVQPATIRFTSGTTQTVSAFGVSGTSGNLITLDTTVAGSQATLSDSSGTNAVSFVSIKDIVATGGATWNAPTTSGNVDAGNNTGWNFSAGPSPSVSVEPSIALRSFTERKHF